MRSCRVWGCRGGVMLQDIYVHLSTVDSNT